MDSCWQKCKVCTEEWEKGKLRTWLEWQAKDIEPYVLNCHIILETFGEIELWYHMEWLEKQEIKSRKPMENLWQWTGFELIKTLTRDINDANGKWHFIFSLDSIIFFSGWISQKYSCNLKSMSSLNPILQVWISEMSFINLIWTH